MTSDVSVAVPSFGNPAKGLDDDIFALVLQLEELLSEDFLDKGKYPEGQLPDSIRAVKEYQVEVATCMQRLTDLKLAHSIAHAVATDGPVIASFLDVEVQAQEDRRAAFQISIEDPKLESPAAPPSVSGYGDATDTTQDLMLAQKKYLYKGSQPRDASSVLGDDWDFLSVLTVSAPDDESDSEATSSSTYTKRQETGLQTFSSPGITCCACAEHFRLIDVFRLDCDDVFCRGCLRRVIMTSMEDKTMFPPKCHRQAFSQKAICRVLSAEELDDFRNTEIEVASPVKTYCSNTLCGRFIPPAHITADRADCVRCGTSTCTSCRNNYHEDDCPEDLALQATLALAADQKWQRCLSCRAIVILAKACNHIK